MKTTIFVRILLATLLPLVFVFAMVIITISNIIYANSVNTARETTSWEAGQMAGQFSGKLETVASFLEVFSQNMSELDYQAPDTLPAVEKLLERLLQADPSFHSTWFAFEPGVFSGRGYVYQTLLRQDGVIREISDMSPEQLRDPALSPWYHEPISSGRLFLDMVSDYDYGLGGGAEISATMSVPIRSGDRIIGAVGVDINYDKILKVEELQLGPNWLLMLVSRDGRIVYANDLEQTGRNLFEYQFDNLSEMQVSIYNETPYVGETFSPPAGVDSLICLYPISPGSSREFVHLYLSTPIQDIYAVARSALELIISTSILGLILLGFSVYVATRNIVRPIKQLTTAFNKVSKGELEEVSAAEEKDATPSNVVELNILHAALHDMLTQINLTHELRLKASEEKVEKEKVLAASQAKSQFLANMSHEIRTPMNAILGITEILLHSEQLSEQERKYIGDIKISSGALLTIINDILDISKLESGKLTLEEKDFDFEELLNNLQTMGEYLAAPNGLTFNFEKSDKLPACLHGDDVRLRQVLLNILSNACKFTTQGSVIFRVTSDDGRLIFSIADTGPGISEEDQVALFEPFKRVDTARTVQGTGLGLSISKNLVDMMGGEIRLHSELGKGSTFTVIIREVLGTDCGKKESRDAKRVEYKPGVKVLIVDDNDINLSVADRLLSGLYGFSCDLALSGAEALEKIQANDYVLVFMDHMMPEMDGVETTKRIRALGGKYAAIPVIALTANAVKGAREAMLDSGIDDYLSKPIEIDTLDSVLAKWVPAELKVG